MISVLEMKSHQICYINTVQHLKFSLYLHKLLIGIFQVYMIGLWKKNTSLFQSVKPILASV